LSVQNGSAHAPLIDRVENEIVRNRPEHSNERATDLARSEWIGVGDGNYPVI
jgi:hypothetical protein